MCRYDRFEPLCGHIYHALKEECSQRVCTQDGAYCRRFQDVPVHLWPISTKTELEWSCMACEDLPIFDSSHGKVDQEIESIKDQLYKCDSVLTELGRRYNSTTWNIFSTAQSSDSAGIAFQWFAAPGHAELVKFSRKTNEVIRVVEFAKEELSRAFLCEDPDTHRLYIVTSILGRASQLLKALVEPLELLDNCVEDLEEDYWSGHLHDRSVVPIDYLSDIKRAEWEACVLRWIRMLPEGKSAIESGVPTAQVIRRFLELHEYEGPVRRTMIKFPESTRMEDSEEVRRAAHILQDMRRQEW